MSTRSHAPVWVVGVSIEDEDVEVVGPYTQAQAERVAARLTEEVALTHDQYGGNHHPANVMHASAWPLSRWDQWMTGEERREARAAVRAANHKYDEE